MASTGQASDRPSPHDYAIREGESRRDMFYLRWQWDHYFGTGCRGPSYLPNILADVLGWVDDEEDRPVAVTAPVAEHEGVHIGGGVASIKSHEDTVRELPDGRFDAEALAGDTNAWLLFGVVDPAWRGHGIGRDLFRYRLRWAKAQGADMVYSFGWEREGRSSRPLFEGHGFVPIQRFEDFYATEPKRGACPDCGTWESDGKVCHCATTLWAIDGGDLRV